MTTPNTTTEIEILTEDEHGRIEDLQFETADSDWQILAKVLRHAAEARVRELEAHLVASDGARTRAEQQLAAANALLGRLKESAETAIGSIELAYGGYRPDWPAAVTDAVAAFRRIALSAHLSAQPAAPTDHAAQPAAPTDHDRAVLEACEGLPEDMLREAAEENDFAPGQALARAELARREARCWRAK